MTRSIVTICAVAITIAMAEFASADNTIASSTMWFEGLLTHNPATGSYTDTIGAIAGDPSLGNGGYYMPGGPGTHLDGGVWKTPDGREAVGGFDVYAQNGGTVYVQGKTPSTWIIGSDHDAYSEGGPWGTWYDPDVPDWGNYHLELTETTWRVWGFSDLKTGGYNETPLAGTMVWLTDTEHETTGIATETGQNWNPTWTWGQENIPLEYPYFAVKITHSDVCRVSLTPVPAPAAVVLGAIGLGLVGWVRRRFA